MKAVGLALTIIIALVLMLVLILLIRDEIWLRRLNSRLRQQDNSLSDSNNADTETKDRPD